MYYSFNSEGNVGVSQIFIVIICPAQPQACNLIENHYDTDLIQKKLSSLICLCSKNIEKKEFKKCHVSRSSVYEYGYDWRGQRKSFYYWILFEVVLHMPVYCTLASLQWKFQYLVVIWKNSYWLSLVRPGRKLLGSQSWGMDKHTLSQIFSRLALPFSQFIHIIILSLL